MPFYAVKSSLSCLVLTLQLTTDSTKTVITPKELQGNFLTLNALCNLLQPRILKASLLGILIIFFQESGMKEALNAGRDDRFN